MRPALPLLAAAALAFGLAGCATPRERIAQRLETAGVPPATAMCLGIELERRLSIQQLVRLSDAVEPVARRAAGRPLNAGDVAEAALRVGDPAIIGAVTAAGLSCAMR